LLPAPPGIVRRATASSYVGFLAIGLGYAVLEEGGRSFVEWNVCLLLIGLVALVYWRRTAPADLAPSIEPWLAWAVVIAPAYVAFQLVPLPVFVLKILSPIRAETVASLEAVMQPPAFASLSVDPAGTVPHLLNIIACALTFLLVREVTWRCRQRQSWAPVVPLIAIAAVEAGLGLWQAASDADVQGTYRSRNHFAGLLEMTLPMTVAYAVALLGVKRFHGVSRGPRTLGGCVVLSLAGVMLLGLAHSLSRMGFVAGLSGLFVMGALAVATTLQGAKKRLSMAGLASCGLLAFFALPTDQLVGRFGYLFSDGFGTGGGRWRIWLDTLHLLGGYPLFGCGLGNYGTAFLKYQTTGVDRAFTFAHNDYLQLASELGAVGFSIFAALMLAVFIRAIRAATGNRDWNTRALGLGCVGTLAAIAVHSLADFNMYIPGNALLLAWISGIAVGLPMRSVAASQIPSRAFFRRNAIALACLLVVYAPASIAAATAFRGNLQAERHFCRFGICDMDAVLDVQTDEHGGTVEAVPIVDLLEAVRRDPASPQRWCDLGEAMLRSGRVEQARLCFANALALGPNIPPVLLRAAHFYHDVGEHERALAQTSRVLEQTHAYDDVIFNWYREKKMPVAELLDDGLPGAPRVFQAYLRHSIRASKVDDATVAWTWLLAHRYADDRIAHEYVNFLYGDRRYEAAARSWAVYLGSRRNGYMESDWLFNGGFESDPSGTAFDWRMGNLNDDVEVALDGSVARSGARSLRVRFGGKENVSYSHTSETSSVTPGVYRFEAFIRAQDITTDRGIGFRIVDPEQSSRVDLRTELIAGTTDWKRIEQIVRVPHETRLLAVRVVRPRSLKFDSLIGGTAWIDDVSLARIE
jgi:O-antigen ligase